MHVIYQHPWGKPSSEIRYMKRHSIFNFSHHTTVNYNYRLVVVCLCQPVMLQFTLTPVQNVITLSFYPIGHVCEIGIVITLHLAQKTYFVRSTKIESIHL